MADPDGVLRRLAHSVTPYPARLRDALLAALWQIGLDVTSAQKGAARGDVGYVALCLSHAALLAAHGWHARASRWVLNEKGAIPSVADLPIDTGDFSSRVTAVLGSLGSTSDSLLAAVEAFRGLPMPA